MSKETTKIPNDLMDKYLPLFTTSEQYAAILDLIKQSYGFGYDDGMDDQYKLMTE
jgi:hypothetical protein